MKEKTLKSSFSVRSFRLFLGLLFFLGGFVFAQTRYTPAELDTLVSTIALYPDPLLVHVLDATTHGDDLPSASAFATANRHLKGDDLAAAIERAELDYDESVIALIPFPDVLRKLAKYATWSHQLGEAVEMQKADVMDAVQRMRRVAHKNGYLNSDDKVSVTVNENVSIQPVREEYVYVPEYDPRVVYYVVSDGNIRLRYVNGVWTGAGLVYWGWDPFYYDWVHRRPHYRHPHRYASPPRHRQRRVHHIRFDNPPPPPPRSRMDNPSPANYRRPAAPPPPRSNSFRESRPVPPASASQSLSKSAASEPRPTAPPSPSSNYRRPFPPPPPPASSSDDQDSRRAERRSGPHNPPPPPHRGEGRRR
jgi:U5 snRNP spliceosome subunit